MRIMLKLIATVFAVVVLLAGVFPVLAQPTGEGFYTTVQADGGAVAYTEQCAVCHLDNLQGSWRVTNAIAGTTRTTSLLPSPASYPVMAH